MILQEVRSKYPQYRNVDDKTLADALYKKYYAGRVTREDFDRQTGLEEANTGILRTVADQAGQGLTFGLADEAQDLINAGVLGAYYKLKGESDPAFSYGELYKDARRISKRDIEGQQKERPWLSTGAQLAGGLALGAGTSKAGSSALSRIADKSLGARALAGAGVGAGYGGAYGFGSGFGTEDRLARAGTGAVVGGVIGGALPVAGALAKYGADKVSNFKSNKVDLPGQTSAEKALVKRYAERPDLEDVAKSSRKALEESKKSGVPVTSAEALSDESLMRELGTLREDPKVMGTVQKFFNAREESIVPKALDDLQQGIAPVTVDEANAAVIKSAQQVKDTLIQKAREQAAPLYDEAYQIKNIASKKIDKILKTPAGKKALSHAREKMQNDSTLLGVPDKELSGIIKDLANAGKMKATQAASGLKLRTLDYVKRSFDDMIESSKRSGNMDDVRIYTKLKNGLLSEMDEVSPAYKQARGIYSESMTEMDDILSGRFGKLIKLTDMQKEKATSELFRGTTGETRKIASQLSPEARMSGGSGELARIAESNKNSPLTIGNKIGFKSKRVQEQWKTILGDKYPDFEAMMNTIERAAKGTKSAMGSPTREKLAAEGRIGEQIADIATHTISGNKTWALMQLRKFITGPLTRGHSEKSLRDQADLLMSERGVKLIEELADSIKKRGSKSVSTTKKLLEIEGLISSASTEAAIATK